MAFAWDKSEAGKTGCCIGNKPDAKGCNLARSPNYPKSQIQVDEFQHNLITLPTPDPTATERYLHGLSQCQLVSYCR